MVEVPKALYERIISLLLPLMDTLANRQGWVLSAFQEYPEFLARIDWSGDAHSFTIRLVEHCNNYGEVAPGQQALFVLLEAVRARVGYDRQVEIDTLRSQLGQPPIPPAIMPYRGLQAFRVEDAPFFFGRDELLKRLVAKVNETRFVVVVGGSGSGKSSLVCAGLVAHLQKTKSPWHIGLMRPFTNPLFEIVKLLYRPLTPDLTPEQEPKFFGEQVNWLLQQKTKEQRTLSLQSIISTLRSKITAPYLLLVVDQFEEIFDPRIDESSRQDFVDILLDLHATGWVKLVLVLRSDFLGALPKYRDLEELVGSALFYITPMNRAEHLAAIEQPARHAGRRFEAGLVKRIVDDLEDASSDLPLLQFALTELWQRQSPDGVLTHAAYEAINGVSGAIAQHAQAVYTTLTATEQAQTRLLFERRLVKIPESGEALTHSTRRRINLDDLDETTQKLITQTLTAQGLLVTDRDEVTGERTVEIVHEALIQQWQALQEWLTQNQENLRTHQTLTEAVEIWERFQQSPALLYRGEQLHKAKLWAAGHRDELITKERDFLQASQRWVWYRWGSGVGSVALVGVLAFILMSWSPWQTEKPIPIPMPAADFNIAVATFGIQNLNLVSDQNLAQNLRRDSQTFSIKIASFLKERRENLENELNGRNVNILESNQFQLAGMTLDALAQKAQELQADLIVYGNLSQGSGRRWQVVPRYYVADRTVVERAREALNEDMLSNPISYVPGNDEDITNVLTELTPRLNTLLVLSRGLPSYDLGNAAGYEKASQIFCNSTETEQPLTNHPGAELLYFFCGKAKEQLAWLQRNDAGWEPTLLQEAFAAYTAGLVLNPKHTRTQINLAALLIQVYRPSLTDCSMGNYEKLSEAEEILKNAIADFNVYTTISDSTKSVALLNLGDVYFWIGHCFVAPESRQEKWNLALANYDQVIRMKEHSTTRPDLINYSVSQSYTQKGVIKLIVYGSNLQAPQEESLTSAIADFNQAIAILLKMQDDTYVADYTIEVMPWALTAFCLGGQDNLAKQYLDEFSRTSSRFDRTKVLNNVIPSVKEQCNL